MAVDKRKTTVSWSRQVGAEPLFFLSVCVGS